MSSAATILAVTAAANHGGTSYAGPAIWMLVMLVAIIPWASYISSDDCMTGSNRANNATIALIVFGALSAAAIALI